MKTTFQGRIIEIGREIRENQEFSWVELFSESVSRVFILPPEITTQSLTQGQITSITVDSEDRVVSVQSIGLPPQSWNPLSDTLRWRRPLGKKSRMSKLRQRQEIIVAIRNFLYDLNYLEIDPPLLIKNTCPDSHIESIPAGSVNSDSAGYLVTSTEYQIKRLMVGGFEKVFTLTKNFRANDRGRYHASEFTMLEWARAYGTLHEIEKDAEGFIKKAFLALYPKQNFLEFQGQRIDLIQSTWERITVREAFEKYLNLKDLKDFSGETLLKSSQKAKIEIPKNFVSDPHLVLSYLLDQLQPHLGRRTPTFLRDWPAFMTSSGQVNLSDPTISERSELYICGIEIADGFPFLTDPELQRKFFERELKRRKDHSQPMIPIDELYLDALKQGIPPGAGMALGIDRLALVLTQSEALAEVQAFNWDEI
jgi:lysyl-tRNA synthetase class 2